MSRWTYATRTCYEYYVDESTEKSISAVVPVSFRGLSFAISQSLRLKWHYDWTLALVRIPWPYVVSCRLQKLAIRDFLEKLHQTLVVTLASNFANWFLKDG